MKVHYKSICREIEAEIYKAKQANRTIERIVLSPVEWNEFSTELMQESLYLYSALAPGEEFTTYLGVRIVKELPE